MFNFLKVKHPFTMRLDSHLPHASQNRYAHTLVQSLIIQLVGRLKFSCLAFVRSMALFQPGLSSSQNVASFHVDSPGSTSKESLLRYTNFSIHAAATVIFCNHSHLEFMLSRDNTGNAGQQVKQPWHKKPQSLLLVVLPAFNFTCVKDVSSSLFFWHCVEFFLSFFLFFFAGLFFFSLTFWHAIEYQFFDLPHNFALVLKQMT